MSFLKLSLRCLSSPRLFKVYQSNANAENKFYEPNILEKWGDFINDTVNNIWTIGLYAGPIAFVLFFKISFDLAKTVVLGLATMKCIMMCSSVMRACGRARNPVYLEFLEVFDGDKTDHMTYVESLQKYDFDFAYWPVSFSAEPKLSKFTKIEMFQQNPFNNVNDYLPIYARIPIKLLAFIITPSFALSLIYPGSLRILQIMVGNQLYEGREVLGKEYNGQRGKISTIDHNTIDTMFVDRRKTSKKGHTLVLCCEGNAGFYEIGIMMTAIKTEYSVLGWNRPGFCCSSGNPFPKQEHNAMDAVIQYAIQTLEFNIEDIVLFGWSIGGYNAVWAAVNYPDVKGLVLDATFDDLLPLAKKAMPSSWEPLVKEVVRTYVNLDIAEMIKKYSGPLHILRRTEDEIICINEGRLSTNRGNYLTIKVILKRHPEMNNETCVKSLFASIGLNEQQRELIEATTSDETDKQCLQIISRYMKDVKGSHCIPLPEQYLVEAVEKYLVLTKNVPASSRTMAGPIRREMS